MAAGNAGAPRRQSWDFTSRQEISWPITVGLQSVPSFPGGLKSILAEVVQLLRENLAEENCRRAVQKLEQLIDEFRDGDAPIDAALAEEGEMALHRTKQYVEQIASDAQMGTHQHEP